LASNDAFGRMVENQSRGFEIVYSPADGSVLAAMQGQSVAGVYVPLPGRATALYDSSGLVEYFHADWQGSKRLLSTPGRSAFPLMAYAPFGEGYAGGTLNDVEFTEGGYSFTLLDPENGSGSLQDFMFRRYSPTQGRWISPDPLGVGAVDPTNPQTWNRYAYVANNPLSHTDPLGLDEDECNPDTDDCSGGGGGGPDPGPDPATPAPPPVPVSIPGFCDASCGGSGFGGGVDANGIPTNFGPGYLMQATSGPAIVFSDEQRYLNQIYDPCVYTNDDGSYSVDPNSSPDECTKTQGHWVPPGAIFTVDSNGNLQVFQTPPLSLWQAMQDPGYNGGLCTGLHYFTWGTGIGAGVLGVSAPFTGGVSVAPAAVLGLASIGGEMARSYFNCQ
jgi:RHS repeat-associated protein